MKKILFSLAALAALSMVAVGCQKPTDSTASAWEKDIKADMIKSIEEAKNEFVEGTKDVVKCECEASAFTAELDKHKKTEDCCLKSVYDAELKKFDDRIKAVKDAKSIKELKEESDKELPYAMGFKSDSSKVKKGTQS